MIFYFQPYGLANVKEMFQPYSYLFSTFQKYFNINAKLNDNDVRLSSIFIIFIYIKVLKYL